MQLIGTLGKDAEVKDVDKTKVINFSVAVNQGYGEKKTTLWVDAAKFGDKTAVANYLKKGTKVFISGEPTLVNWTSKTGTSGTSLRLRVNELELLGENKTKQSEDSVSEQIPASSESDLPF
ncbi:MAG: single-stranded DNA-binding protein [Leadbetterella sp.]